MRMKKIFFAVFQFIIEIKNNETVLNENVLISTVSQSSFIRNSIASADLKKIGEEGFIIRKLNGNKIIITANTDIGILYGVFHFLRLLQTNQNLQQLSVISSPKIKLRILNH